MPLRPGHGKTAILFLQCTYIFFQNFHHCCKKEWQNLLPFPHMHRKKIFSIFPSPAGMSLTKLWGREYRKAFFTVWPVKVPWELSPTVVGQTRPRNVEVDADARVEGMKGASEHLQRSHHPRHGRLQGGQVRPRHTHEDVVPWDRVQVHESW